MIRRSTIVPVVLGALLLGSTAWVLAQPQRSESTPTPDAIVNIEPISDTVLQKGGTALMQEWLSRLEDWSAQFAVRDMSARELAAGMDALTSALVSLDETEDEWLRQRELMMRQTTLCQLLPSDHAYRGGEYCD